MIRFIDLGKTSMLDNLIVDSNKDQNKKIAG